MHKTILVIGEVTRNQYQPMRLDILRDGYKPKVVRYSVEELKELFEKKFGDQLGLERTQAMGRVLAEKGVQGRDVSVMITNLPLEDKMVDDAMYALRELLTMLDKSCFIDDEGHVRAV